jgi:hypothetical protein
MGSFDSLSLVNFLHPLQPGDWEAFDSGYANLFMQQIQTPLNSVRFLNVSRCTFSGNLLEFLFASLTQTEDHEIRLYAKHLELSPGFDQNLNKCG